ncbi:MAG: hypothetical protein AMJ56_06050 [Anaerolineae bacterium SG8_19]|jgi:hypothetical protein|nr:MAG: hypothetical protein AMJ56_06050 [Anaerolineae bacterium SG8_19]
MDFSNRKSFIPGLRLSERFYFDAVRNILEKKFPGIPYAAGLIGSGSEVLGFDDPMSTDHHWGPRLLLFLLDEDHHQYSQAIRETLGRELPYKFLGYPTNFSEPVSEDNITQLLQSIDQGPINHRVDIFSIRGFFLDYLNFDIEQDIRAVDWLTFPAQRLLTITAGSVYHDAVGLDEVRARFEYYPHDVWIYLLAAGWARIEQEEHLMGRAGWAGDDVGSALIAAWQVRDIMRLCFLMEKQYPPYAKWFGTAFNQLECANDLLPILQKVLGADSWQHRDKYLAEAYEIIASMHNGLKLTEMLPEKTMAFHGRPFQVMAMHGFTNALRKQIRDPEVQEIAKKRPIGSIDQFIDSTDLLSYPEWRPFLRRLYE